VTLTVEISTVRSGDYVMCAQVIMSCVHRACDVRLLIVLNGQPCILYVSVNPSQPTDLLGH